MHFIEKNGKKYAKQLVKKHPKLVESQNVSKIRFNNLNTTYVK